LPKLNVLSINKERVVRTNFSLEPLQFKAIWKSQSATGGASQPSTPLADSGAPNVIEHESL
jgi:hypothetical protein